MFGNNYNGLYQAGFNPYNNFSGFGNMTRGMRSSNLAGLGNGIGALKGKFSFSGFLANTQKTLGIINQAIPIFYQIKPMWNNAKTMFKVASILKDDDEVKPNKTNQNHYQENNNESNYNDFNQKYTANQPTFFI